MGQFSASATDRDIDTIKITVSGTTTFQTVWDGEIDASAGHYAVNESQNVAVEIDGITSTSILETDTLGSGLWD